MNKHLNRQCSEIIRKLMARHRFLQPDNPNFDIWNEAAAAELLADLIIEINQSEEIQQAHTKEDWGK